MAQNIVILKIKQSPAEKLLLKLERPIIPENRGVYMPIPRSLSTDVRRFKNNQGRAIQKTAAMPDIICSDDVSERSQTASP